MRKRAVSVKRLQNVCYEIYQDKWVADRLHVKLHDVVKGAYEEYDVKLRAYRRISDDKASPEGMELKKFFDRYPCHSSYVRRGIKKCADERGFSYMELLKGAEDRETFLKKRFLNGDYIARLLEDDVHVYDDYCVSDTLFLEIHFRDEYGEKTCGDSKDASERDSSDELYDLVFG